MTTKKWQVEEHFSSKAWIFTAPCGAEYLCPFSGGVWRGRNYLKQLDGTCDFRAGSNRRTALARIKRWHDCAELACGEDDYADIWQRHR